MADKQQHTARKLLFPSIETMSEIVIMKTPLEEDLVVILAYDHEGYEDHLPFHPTDDCSAMDVACNLSRIFGLPYEDRR